MEHPAKKQKFNYIHNLKDIRCELCCSELYSFTNNCDEYNDMYPFGNEGIQFCCKNPNCKTYYYACEKCSNEKEDYIVLCQFLHCWTCDDDYKGKLRKFDEEDEVDILDFSERNQFHINLDDPDMTSDGKLMEDLLMYGNVTSVNRNIVLLINNFYSLINLNN
jgi:hypothetical protein